MKSRDNVARIPRRKMRKMMAKLAMPQVENLDSLTLSSVGVRSVACCGFSLFSLLLEAFMRRVALPAEGMRKVRRFRGEERGLLGVIRERGEIVVGRLKAGQRDICLEMKKFVVGCIVGKWETGRKILEVLGTTESWSCAGR